jgi:ABC-type glycerol-3-phosphate transport system substrate-binding protein
LNAATLEGGLYGIPQTFDYYMFFYRTDIFEEYGFEVPKTWQELIDLIPNMQRNGLEVGIPHDLNAYAMFLDQNQGRLYKDGGASVDLGSKQAIDTFCDFTELYTLYNLPVTFDFSNRFRTGEMACGIQMYSAYNQLTAFAPEIKGKWEMVPVPGVMQENGTIDNTSMGTCSYIMMMNSCKNQEEAWKFIKWFMSTEIQSQYAVRMESILGTCAKVTTANVEALGEMTWNSKEYKNLWEQLDNVATVPQVPGGYYMSRILGFAFNRVYNSSSTQNMGEEPAEVLVEYIDEINQEIERKRKEFGLWVPN